jgi:4-amino-4-deoxy-L-arabinose transferase-like glycosyltransferase
VESGITRTPHGALFFQAIRWCFQLWLIGITLRFCGTVTNALQSHFTPGYDIAWVLGWTSLVIVLMLGYGLARTRGHIVTSTSAVICAASAAVVIVLSHTVPAFLVAGWIVLISAGLGSVIARIFLRREAFSLDQLACGLPLGTAGLALATFILGILQILTPAAIWALLAAVTIAVASQVARLLQGLARELRSYTRQSKEDWSEFGLLLAIIAFTTLVNLTWAIAPEVQYDPLNYHLAIPKAWMERSGIFEIQFLQAYLARLIEMIFSICLAVGGPETAKAWVFLVHMCSAVGVFALGKVLFNVRIGVWAATLYVTTPLVAWGSGTAYIDNVVALFVVASFLALVRWYANRTAGWLYVAALLAGSAVGSKLNAAFAFVAIAPIVLFHVVRDRTQSRASRLRIIFCGVLAFTLVAAPTYILTYAFTGNPIFPLMNGIFQSPKWELDNRIFNASNYGLGTAASSLVRFPFRMMFDTSRFGEALPRGGLGLSLLLAFPFAVGLLGNRTNGVHLLVAATAVYLVLLFYTMQYGRFYIAILPLVAIIGVATVFHLTPVPFFRVAQVCLLLVAITQPLVHSVQFWNISERFPISLAFGLESREDFLKRALLGYSGVRYLNTVSGPGETIVGVGTEDLRFYLRSSLETLPVSVQGSSTRGLMNMKPDAELAAAMKRDGFVYLFVTRAMMKDPSPWFPYLDQSFLQSNAISEFEDDYALVYRLR